MFRAIKRFFKKTDNSDNSKALVVSTQKPVAEPPQKVQKVQEISKELQLEIDRGVEITANFVGTYWKPNDKLIKDYNKSTKHACFSYEYENKIKHNQLRLRDFKQQFNETPTESVRGRIERQQLKLSIMNLEQEIKKYEDLIYETQTKPMLILDEYDKYLNEAEAFIKQNDLQKVLKTSDILTSQNLYIKAKEIMDEGLLSVDSEEAYEKLLLVSSCFDLRDVYKDARGKQAAEFLQTFNDKRFLMYDGMDIKYLGTTMKIPESDPENKETVKKLLKMTEESAVVDAIEDFSETELGIEPETNCKRIEPFEGTNVFTLQPGESLNISF